MLTDVKKLIQLVLCQVFRQICFACFFIQIARSLGNDAPWLWGYIVAVSQELSIILKFTPGNVGIAEMVSGFVSALTGVPATVGINVSLFKTLLQMILIFLIGGLSSFFILGKGFNPARQLKSNLDE